MLLRGQLWATSDEALINQALMQGIKVIYLGDPISINPQYKEKFVVSSILVPDYQTMSLLVDGDYTGFANLYVSALSSNAATEMFSVIFACLYNGVHVIFYLPKEAQGLNYVQYLLQFIEINYGITTQTKTTQFAFDQKFSTKIAELLYLNSLINAQDFLINSESLDNLTLNKLVKELHPMVKDPTDLKQIIQWFSNYKDAIIEANRPLINGIQYAGDEGDYACC